MSKIYTPQGRAREYSPLAFNFYRGCTHGCTYCYVPKMFRRFNPSYDHGSCEPNISWMEFEDSARKMQGCDKQILLSFTGDPYCGVAPEAVTRVLEVLNFYGHKVAVLSKGGKRMLNDIDVFKSFGDRIKIGATLSFYDNEKSAMWEPKAASPRERIDTLAELSSQGVKTWASFEPVVETEEAMKLLDDIVCFIDHVKVGKLNGYAEIEKTQDWKKFSIDFVKKCRENNVGVYVKKSLSELFDENEKHFFLKNELDFDFLNL